MGLLLDGDRVERVEQDEQALFDVVRVERRKRPSVTATAGYGIVFAVSAGTLVFFVGVAILAGMLPARRASKLNIGKKLQSE